MQRGLSDAELLWVVKNGLKMTGMPSFGKTHTKKQLWGIVAFLRRLPNLTTEEYKAMVESEMESGHEHGEEGQEHKGAST